MTRGLLYACPSSDRELFASIGEVGLPEPAHPGIFISYRRSNARHLAGRLADHLEERFGESQVFMDVASIDAGDDFVTVLREAVAACDVLLAIIDPKWVTIRTEDGSRRRLDDPDDFVVLEVATALDRGIPVIPVLVDGATMPRPEELPEVLKLLPRRQAFPLTATAFGVEVDRLEDRLEDIIGPGPRPWWRKKVDRRTLFRIGGGTAVAAIAGLAGRELSRWLSDAPDPWLFQTGGPVFSSPEVVNGTLYTGSNDGHLYALNAGSGLQLWSYRAGGAISSSPAVADGLVVVGADDFGVHAVDAATGALRWVFPTGGKVHSSPAIAAGKVYVGSRDANVYAIDAVSGQELWSFAGDDWFNSSPTVVDGVVYIGCRDHEIYALNAEDGLKRWSYTTESTVDSSAFVEGDTVWIGSDDSHVYAIGIDGSFRWQTQTGGGVVSTPAVSRDALYVGSDDGNLYAMDRTTGRRRWTFPTGNSIRSSPALSGSSVYVGSRDRRVYSVDTVSGEERWRFETNGPIDDSSPKIVDGLLYVGSLDGFVYAIDAGSGTGRAPSG